MDETVTEMQRVCVCSEKNRAEGKMRTMSESLERPQHASQRWFCTVFAG